MMPVLTYEQRMAAIKKGADARRTRSQAKEDFVNGRVSISDLLDSTDEAIKRMRVFDLIRCIRSVGDVKAARFMSEAKISQRTRLGGLGVRQRKSLEEFLVSKGFK